MSRKLSTPSLDISIEVAAPPARVLKAFFDFEAMRAWWQVTHAVVTPRTLGAYAVQWETTDFKEETLGRLGGVFHGTVMQFEPAQGFFVADVYWLPPDGDPIGPMAFEVQCTPVSAGDPARTRLRVMQRGFEESVRWRRYYELAEAGWSHALATLKALLER